MLSLVRLVLKVGSFDGGFGASYLARIVGQKKAREIWFLCRQYSAQQALDMGLVNCVVPVENLESEGIKWSEEILNKSPIAIRLSEKQHLTLIAMDKQDYKNSPEILHYFII